GQASYSSDVNNNAGSSACASELLSVGVAGVTIVTTLSSSSISVGGSVHDSATLSGQTANAGGTVTYAVYTNNTCTSLASVQPSPATVTITNGVVPNSAAVTFPAAGTFFWHAVSSGDANNAASTSAGTTEQLT